MSQHDMNIANADGATVRADINNALLALVTNNSGATEPATKFAYMWWADTTSGYWKQRNAANTAWLNKFKISEGELALIAGSSTQTFSGAAATAAEHLVRADQIQKQSLTAFTTGGTSTAYTLTPAPAITANAAGIEFDVTFNAAAGATPTLAVSGLTALSLMYRDSTGALVAITSKQVPINWRSKVVCVDSGGTLYWVVRETAVGGVLTFQVFAANGTWTKPAGCKKVRVQVVGGGGGGAASATNNGSAGATSSFGTYCSAAGGAGGVTAGGNGGAAGQGSGGDINIYGTDGGSAGGSDGKGNAGHGGGSTLGGGGRGGIQSAVGSAGLTYGGGGGGGGAISVTSNGGGGGGGGGTAIRWLDVSAIESVTVTIGAGGAGGAAGSYAGGNGAAGVVIVEEFY